MFLCQLIAADTYLERRKLQSIMEFRPCIDIHNGRIKQIVGASLQDEGDLASENFVSKKDADFFAGFYKEEGLVGGHVIMLNAADSPYYEETKKQALLALRTYPGGLQVGGGINPSNAQEFLDAGASHVIVTSYVFKDGRVNYDHLKELVDAVGKEHLVLDVSCRKKDDAYYVVTDRWQKFTQEEVTPDLLDRLSSYCDEFLVHAADVEGKQQGIEEDIVKLLGDWGKIPITYAGGIHSYDDILRIQELSDDKLNFTIGSALDLFGGHMNYETVRNLVQGV